MACCNPSLLTVRPAAACVIDDQSIQGQGGGNASHGQAGACNTRLGTAHTTYAITISFSFCLAVGLGVGLCLPSSSLCRERKKSGARELLTSCASMSVLKTSNPVATMRRQVVEWCATAAVIFGAADAFTPLVLLNNAPAARPNRATSLTMVEVRLSPLRVVQSCLKSGDGARSPSCCLHSKPSSGVVQHC